jgi:hypothetical protein
LELTDENQDYADCSPPPSQYKGNVLERAPEYIKAGIRRRQAELAQARRAALRVAPDFGIGPEELARLEGMTPTTEAEFASVIVDEAELAASGRWGGQPEPPRWIPLSAERAPKLIAASELFDDGPYCDFARRPRP